MEVVLVILGGDDSVCSTKLFECMLCSCVLSVMLLLQIILHECRSSVYVDCCIVMLQQGGHQYQYIAFHAIGQDQLNCSHVCYACIWSVSYSLEKNSGSDGGVTSFTNQARTRTSIVRVISRLIGHISRLGIGLVD